MVTPKLHADDSVLADASRLDCYSPPLGGEGKRPRRNIMRRFNLLIVSVAAVGALLTAAPAMAASASSTIYKECEDNGQITGHFTRAQLQSALGALPSEVSEYSDCQDLIQQALLRAASPNGGGRNANSTKAHIAGTGRGGGNGSSGSGGGRGKGSGSARNGQSARTGSGKAVSLAGADIRPGSTGTSGSSSALPLALVVVLILLALTAVSGGAVAIRRRVVARHST